MKQITGKKSGLTSLRLEYAELYALPGGKAWHEAMKAHWAAGQKLQEQGNAIVSKAAGAPRVAHFRFGGVQITLPREAAPAKSAAVTTTDTKEIGEALAAFNG